MSDTQEAVVNYDPAFGAWVDRDITPQMVRGKMIWVTANITRVRRELHQAEQSALAAKHAYEDAFAAGVKEAMRMGATSNTDAERTASRLRSVVEAKRAREHADLGVKALRDELDEYYRGQMPAVQSLNRVVLAEYHAEWAGSSQHYQ